MRANHTILILSCALSFLGAQAADFLLIERVAIFGDLVGLQYSLNPGIAFGIQMPPLIQSVLIGAALVIIFLIARTRSTNTLAHWGYELIIGGGIANILDRLLDGHVTDYFQVGTFPIFNIADSCVTVGVVLLLLEAFLSPKRTTDS